MRDTIMIVGFGFAGNRMLRVLEHAWRTRPGPHLQPVIIDPRQYPDGETGYRSFRSLDEALASCRAGAAIVAVNEKDHHGILRSLIAAGVPHIMSEKPLTATLAEAYDIRARIDGRVQFSMNMVERFSPVFSDFFQWRASQPAIKAARIQLFWGKNRIRDARPTMGVLSEAIHPLDLAAFAFDINDLEVLAGYFLHSDFSSDTVGNVADSLHCKLRADTGAVVTLNTSFAWMERRREMFAHLVSAHSSHIAQFTFDSPRWDCDSLRIFEIDPLNGARKLVLERTYSNEDFPATLYQLSKVHSFVTTSLALSAETPKPSTVVDFAHAIRLQEWLERIGQVVASRDRPLREKLFPAQLAAAEAS